LYFYSRTSEKDN